MRQLLVGMASVLAAVSPMFVQAQSVSVSFPAAVSAKPVDGRVLCLLSSWNGDPELPNALSRLHYNTMYVPKIMERIAKTAPAGADMSWKC